VYARLADDFAATISAVDDDQWGLPSPCDGWTARDLVGHVVDAHGIFLRLVGRELGDIPSVEDDPAAAFAAARAVVAADLDDPERAGATFDGLSGRTTFEEAIERFLVGDLLIHCWDLARATGGDERLDLDDYPVGQAQRSSGSIPPVVPGAGNRDRKVKASTDDPLRRSSSRRSLASSTVGR